MDSEQIGQMAADLFNDVFETLDEDTPLTADEAKKVATAVEKAFLAAMIAWCQSKF